MSHFTDEELIQWAKDWVLEHWQLTPAYSKTSPLTQGGSARRYFRISYPNETSIIACAYNPHERKENTLFIPIAHFLEKQLHLPIPEIYAHDSSRYGILLEDAGHTDLHSLRTMPRKIIESAYQQTIHALIPLYTDGLQKATIQALPLMPSFDHALYTWEQNYFLNHAIKQFAQICVPPCYLNPLSQAMYTITEFLLAAPQTLVHRDLQSQNILIHRGHPVFIDFQGMRRGTFFYDLASLIYDPYMEFEKNFRQTLIHHCYQIFPPSLKMLSHEQFTLNLKIAAAQRLMQALGAYANLGLNLGKTHFLQYILPASRLLHEVLNEIQSSLHLSSHLLNLSAQLFKSAQAASFQAPTSCPDSTADPTQAPHSPQ
jgi:aminoglycoside/choline kinase family phosphotransferase